MKAAIYIRVSDQQQTRGSSLADQEKLCREFATRSGYKVAKIYRDEGRSAYKDDLKHRPEFSRLLVEVAGGSYQAVIVYKLDRFARRARIFHTCRWQLEQSGVQLLSSTEPNDTSAAGRLSSGMLAEFAEFYSAQLSERIKSAQAGKAARGLWVGSAPFGYELHAGQLVPGRLWLWVVAAFVAYDLGASSVQIATALNAAGVQLGSGKPWTKDSVLMVLRNHAYIGRAGGRAIAAYDAAHRPLISRDLWDRVQERLGSRRKRPQAPRKPSQLPELTYEPRCALCNGRMQRHRQPKAMYFRCRGSINQTCAAKGIKLDLVDHQVELLRRGGSSVSVVWLKSPRGVECFE